MSAEVVAKKRGRPKKIISDPIEVESIKISTTRTKPTRATAKPVPAKTVATTSATATKQASASKTVSKPVQKAASPTVVSPTSPLPKASNASTSKPSQIPPPAVSKPIVKAEDRKETIQGSKILSQVQEKNSSPTGRLTAAQSSSKPATPSSQSQQVPASISTIPGAASLQTAKKPVQNPPHVSPPSTAAHSSSAASPTPKPVPIPSTAPSPPPKAAPAPKLPIAALNSAIVNNISTRAGAKPSSGGSKPLPANYKGSARKVTMLIVALPLLIFSSYGLFQRSDEVKLLFNPGSKKVDKEGTANSTPSSAD